MATSNSITKTCSQCWNSFPATPEYFLTSYKSKDGFLNPCKKCRSNSAYFRPAIEIGSPGFMGIPLTQGRVAIVDSEDADLSQYSWQVLICGKNKDYEYGIRSVFVAPHKKKRQLMHVAIMERVLGRSIEEGLLVDHIDGNGLNNSRSNLRIATRAENNRNVRRNSLNKSGYKGVYWAKSSQKWHSVITVNGKKMSLGYFTDPEEAYRRYCDAAKHFFGEFAHF